MKYEMTEDSHIFKDIKKGQIVYDLNHDDFGLAQHESRQRGEEYISVTLNENGSFPSFTVKKDNLRECKQ